MKKLLFFVCAIFAFAACTQIIIEEQQGVNVDTPETLTVGFEDGDQTRIQLNEARKTVWTKNDLVSVFYKSNANQKWEYRGETGEQVAELYRVDAGTASRDMDYVVMHIHIVQTMQFQQPLAISRQRFLQHRVMLRIATALVVT